MFKTNREDKRSIKRFYFSHQKSRNQRAYTEKHDRFRFYTLNKSKKNMLKKDCFSCSTLSY